MSDLELTRLETERAHRELMGIPNKNMPKLPQFPNTHAIRMELVGLRKSGMDVEEIAEYYRSKGYVVKERQIRSRLARVLKSALDAEFANALRVHETEKLYEMDREWETARDAEQDLSIANRSKISASRISIHQSLAKLWGLHQNEGNGQGGANVQVNTTGAVEVRFGEVVDAPYTHEYKDAVEAKAEDITATENNATENNATEINATENNAMEEKEDV